MEKQGFGITPHPCFKNQESVSGYALLNGAEVISVHNRLRDLREDADLNQTQIAKYLGMSQTGYSKYETGENDIPTLALIKLAQYYKTSTDYILGLSDDKSPCKKRQKRSE